MRTVHRKHLKTLIRRHDFLQQLKKDNEANSYDLAELSALRWVIETMDAIDETEEETGVNVVKFTSLAAGLSSDET